jgi:basic membrane protein A
MLKRVDNAVYKAFSDGVDMETGFNVMGLSNDGVGYAMDEFNASLVTDEMKQMVETASAQIISGDLAVHDYMSDESCPDLNF